MNTGVHTLTITMRTPGCGCIGHPAVPAPSGYKGRNDPAKSRARRAAGIISIFAMARDDAAFSTVIVRLDRTIQYSRDIND